MRAEVIRLWGGRHEQRIRIPGPGEDNHDAEIIILPVLQRAPPPPRKPRTNRRKTP